MNSNIVAAVHPDPRIRLLVHAVLRDPNRLVRTEPSWRDLLAHTEAPPPDLILIDRSFLGADWIDVESMILSRWPAAEVLVLPENIDREASRLDALIQLLRRVDDRYLLKS